MNELLIIILLVVIALIFNNLNNKIKKLEKEVSDLNAKISPNTTETTVKQQESSSQKITISEQVPSNENQERNLQQKRNNEELPIPEQKDWLSPVFEFLKQNILTIIGIFTLVLGIGYFVKYAIDKNWIGETARAGIGFCTGATIILIGHFLRKNYATFSSIITGGGVAVLYFTATIAFREYHLFSQNTAFIITILITLGSILLSYYYKSEILMIFSLLGGFSAPLMISTGQSNYPFLFIYLTLLNIGMLAITFLKQWKSVGWTAYILTTLYLFYLFSWTIDKPEFLSVVFYIISYIIFYIFALQNYIRKNTVYTPDILMLAFINFSSVTGLVYTFHEIKYEPVIVFPITFALVNMLFLLREYGRKDFGTSFSVFAGITVSLITIAIAIQCKAHLITSIWAVEATLLLFIWKKTGHKIFKTCFYLLFPLVVIAQIFTWTEYFNAKQLSIVFNPIFLTSLVTIISIIISLYLLKNNQGATTQKQGSFFEDSIPLIGYGVIYVAILLEITYHISEMPWSAITNIGILFTLFYIFILLLFKKQQNIGKDLETRLIYIFLLLLVVNASASTSAVVTSILSKELSIGFYFWHLLQWLPFIYVCFGIIPSSDFHKTKISYWIISSVFTIMVSCDLYHSYVLAYAPDLIHSYVTEDHFISLYLPIVWTILASFFIYIGLKRNIQEYNKIGFALIGIMVLKLYSYDVWQMDNISRISAFIVLGLILLLSSFTFQRLKNIIKNMVDKKDKNKEDLEV